MPNDQKQNTDDSNDQHKELQQPVEDASVQRGKAAIEAGRTANPEDEKGKKEKEEKDAEQWRNEG